MHSNRQVLRATHNRLPLKDVSSDKFAVLDLCNKATHANYQQQENRLPTSLKTKLPTTSRPILTAIRSIKHCSKENDDDTHMLVSPMVKTTSIIEQKAALAERQKTRTELEEELLEL